MQTGAIITNILFQNDSQVEPKMVPKPDHNLINSEMGPTTVPEDPPGSPVHSKLFQNSPHIVPN